jgi:hypothetical protein
VFHQVRSLLNASERQLETDTITFCYFHDCVAQSITTEECQTYIDGILGGPELTNHEIPNLKIKVSPLRMTEIISETYWMIGIPTNIYSEVDCEIIHHVDCIGISASACCTTVLDDIKNIQGIPLVDDNGNCLSRWAHQEPLDPINSADVATVVYLKHYDPSGMCQEDEIEAPAVESADTDVEAVLSVLMDQIEGVISSATVVCDIFTELFGKLLFWARLLPHTMVRITSTVCGLCGEHNANVNITLELLTKLGLI